MVWGRLNFSTPEVLVETLRCSPECRNLFRGTFVKTVSSRGRSAAPLSRIEPFSVPIATTVGAGSTR